MIIPMIKSIKHKGLADFFLNGTTKGIKDDHAKKLKMQLIALQTAVFIEDLDLPGYHLHVLKGKRKGVWSIRVNKTWRLTFEFKEADVYLLNYEDYH